MTNPVLLENLKESYFAISNRLDDIDLELSNLVRQVDVLRTEKRYLHASYEPLQKMLFAFGVIVDNDDEGFLEED